MIKNTLNLAEVKKTVDSLKLKTVTVTQNLGRNRFASFVGVIEGVYPALFTVAPQGEYRGKTSFSYSELLCGNVKIKAV